MDVHPHPGPIEPLSGPISICHLNIRSINADSRLGACTNQLANTYDVITMSETWLSETNDNHLYAIPGYTGPYRLDRTLQGGGGVLAWVRDTIVAKERRDLHQYKLEVLWLELKVPKHTLLVGVTYRQPDGTYGDDFWIKLQSSYDLVKATNTKNILLIGDFNAEPSTNRTAATSLDFFLAQNHLSQHITEPTRYHNNKGSLLDLIITNRRGLIKNTEVIAPVHLNDHCTITGLIDLPTCKPQSYKRRMWQYKLANFDDFRNKLNEVASDDCLDEDPTTACENWTKLFSDVVNTNIPHKDVTVRPEDSKWYNGYLRRLCHKQKRDHKKWTQQLTPWARERYKTSRNTYFEEVDRLKQEYNESMAKTLADESKQNPKKWWSIAKETMGNKKSSTIPSMIADDQIYDTDEAKSELFNNYFVDVQSLPNEPDANTLEDQPDPENTLEIITATEKDVDDILKCLNTNKAYGPDGISPKVLKEGRPAIVSILTKLFNLSLTKGIFPTSWKKANVCPLYKKAEEFFTNNYRPISLLDTIAKVFERVVFKYLYNYFRDNFLFSIWQSGFLPGSSTVTQLIEIYDQFCKAVSAGKDIRVVFLDISKAFDRVWHAGLLHKLKGHGIRGRLLKWLQSYLTDRQQRVTINGIHSTWKSIKAGVPQGSVLGPLLFLVFINDITHVIRHCKIRLFADDTCLFIEVDQPDTAAEALNGDLEQIHQWAEKWLVTFSPPKTKEMIITNKAPRPHPPLSLNNHQIESMQSHKHLGLTLTHNLSWREHAEEIAKKANRCLGILRPLKFKLDRKSLEKMYTSFIRPILEYADIIWDVPDTHRHTLDVLDKVQADAARLVTGATARCGTEALYQEVGWEPLAHRRKFHRASTMYKILNGLAPRYLQDLIPGRVQTRTRYQLRNRNDLQVPLARLETYSQSFFPAATRTWNNLTEVTKSSPSVKSFKHQYLKEFPRPPANPLFYRGSRFSAVHHARMRIRCSGLNSDLHNVLHVVDSPLCTCQLGVDETVEHFFLRCPKFAVQRQAMLADLALLNVREPTEQILLFGIGNSSLAHNTKLFETIHKYITSTKRFPS
jgi:hypothetical protein